ncbi:Hypothetical protein PFR_JS4_1606 [Propionibacterium freudenreichii]|nr:Hypothetical protein PFR_JS4_1606 [Propionibacterium freudenreichii]
MINFLVSYPLVTIMGVLSLGALLGQIKFGPCASAPPAPCSSA